MTTPSTAHVRFGPDGLAGVDVTLRLHGGSHVAFYPYDDEPPLVSLRDGFMSVTISVPDRKHVTQADVHKARALAMSFRNYATELAQVLERQNNAAGGEAA